MILFHFGIEEISGGQQEIRIRFFFCLLDMLSLGALVVKLIKLLLLKKETLWNRKSILN